MLFIMLLAINGSAHADNVRRNGIAHIPFPGAATALDDAQRGVLATLMSYGHQVELQAIAIVGCVAPQTQAEPLSSERANARVHAVLDAIGKLGNGGAIMVSNVTAITAVPGNRVARPCEGGMDGEVWVEYVGRNCVGSESATCPVHVECNLGVCKAE